jgi:hypothetical protein
MNQTNNRYEDAELPLLAFFAQWCAGEYDDNMLEDWMIAVRLICVDLCLFCNSVNYETAKYRRTTFNEFIEARLGRKYDKLSEIACAIGPNVLAYVESDFKRTNLAIETIRQTCAVSDSDSEIIAALNDVYGDAWHKVRDMNWMRYSKSPQYPGWRREGVSVTNAPSAFKL